MKIEKLSAFGLPDGIISAWKRSGMKTLSRIQQMAISSGHLFSGDLLILGPTSSGKTFCGEIAALKAAASGRKAIFLSPLKAIAVEKYDDFRKKYETLGVRLSLSTQDDRQDDEKIVKGQFDLAIIIYEKFNRFLTRNINLLSAIDVVVFDEINIIHDPQRGENARVLLMKIISSKNESRILGLGREDFRAASPARLVAAPIVRDTIRPVNLRKGILFHGNFEFRDRNALVDDNEKLIDPFFFENDTESSINPHLKSSLEFLCGRGEQAIVFLKSKNQSINAALEFSAIMQFPRASQTLALISDLEDTSLLRTLKVSLENGIGFHNADLTEFEGKAIIDGFRSGDIRLLFSTTTLACGINLPAKNVFIEPLKFSGESSDLRPIESPMSYSEVDTISGRAGRWGLENGFGRAVLLAANEFEKEILWNRYIEGEIDPKSLISSAISEETIIDLVASGICSSIDELEKSVSEIGSETGLILSDSLELLIVQKFLKCEDNHLQATALGRACALTGLKKETITRIAKIIEGAEGLDDLSFWIQNLSFSREAAEIKLPAWFYYQLRNGAFCISSSDSGESSGTINDAKAQYFKNLITDWIEGVGFRELEENFKLTAGMISDMTRRFSWLLYGAAEIAASSGKVDLSTLLREYAESVRCGLPDKGFPLARLRVYGLGRMRIMELIKENIITASDVCKCGVERIPQSIPENVRNNLYKSCLEISQKKNADKRKDAKIALAENISIFQLNLSAKQDRGKIRISINGSPTLITFKSYLYLRRLAEALKNGKEGWIHRLDLEDGDNQWSYLHRLKKELKEFLPAGAEIIENDRHGCYRLRALPEGIQIADGDIPLVSA
ncbi:MAG: hypothetical protein CO189_04290 [candidate division Zixibacteria bacterium CG_4_9_14_3_um_filter_46_8]|nr:MAG: hypothetical protein CO189_04290 [candidate division Zixibacteria bacterium CG_4_9_14_3_um_filter_46_8]